jgi:hypothetical protein
MSDLEGDDIVAPWEAPPSLKERSAVQRAVERLLDELAPERAVGRATQSPLPIERHRTPRGCILQAPAGAVSVSWFPDAAIDASIGELQVIAWRGTVSRPGSAQRAPGGATVVEELSLRPVEAEGRVEGDAADWRWRAGDGTVYDTASLAAHCLALLERQGGGEGAPADGP